MDTIIEYLPANSFPDRPWGIGNNPETAIRQFMESGGSEHFEIDRSIDDRLLISSAPGGYLKRIK
jgi:cephalosporin hydroxylase